MSSQMDTTDDICVLCCRKVIIYAIGVCDHPVCYECSARMRVLCKQNECPICRQDMPKVVFTQKLELFINLSPETYPSDRKYKIYFEDDICRRMYDKLLEHTCKLCPNKPYFHTFGHLKHHMRRKHERFYCDLCVENLRIFTSERKCYKRDELARHRRVGDVDDTSHRGHPLCEFCDQRYLDRDELFRHLRREHFFCHFCDADGDTNKFYSDYEYLRAHFRKEHYLCEEGACQDEKFTPAFRSEIDLKAHKALQHSKNLSKAQAKQARTLELEFTIKPRNNQQNGYISLTTESFRQNHRHDSQTISTKSNRELNSIRSNTDSPKARNECINTSLNTGSEEEFPRLTSSACPARNVAGATNRTKSSILTKDTLSTVKNQSKSMIPDEDFPALGANGSDYPELQSSASSRSSVDPHPQKSLLFHFNSHNSRQNSANVCIKVEKQKDVNLSLGAASFRDNSNTAVANKKDGSKFDVNSFENGSSVSPFLDKVLNTKKSFEEDFPQLSNSEQQKSAKCLIMPTNRRKNGFQSMVNSNDSCHPFIMVKCKSKKKQKPFTDVISKGTQSIEPDTKESVALTLAQIVNTDIFESHEMDTLQHNNKELNTVGDSSTMKELEKKTENLVVDNSSIGRKVVAPPGFSSASVPTITPPPGFVPSSSDCHAALPPNSLSSIARELASSAGGEVEDASVTCLIDLPKYVYTEPPNYHNRNLSLIQQIQSLLGGNNSLFAEFKMLSSHFRQSSITAEHYYKECLEILGKEGFMKIIPELLVLLPDIDKQQDLLSILNMFFRNKSENTGAVPKGTVWNNLEFEVCETCKQVLSKNDFANHKNKAHLALSEMNR